MIEKIQNWLLLSFAFIFPLFFLPVTQDFYLTSKFYLLATVIILVLALEVVNLLKNKTVSVGRSPIQAVLLFLTLATAGSILIASPNKLEALVLPQAGFLPIFFGVIFCLFLASRKLSAKAIEMIFYSSVILAAISVIFLFNPLTHASLPGGLQFLQESTFTPMGFQLDLAVLMGFMLLYGITRIVSSLSGKVLSEKEESAKTIKKIVPIFIFTFVIGVGLLISSYHILTAQDGVAMAPANVSWSAAIDTLKNPQTAIFGVGLGNYQSSFTRAKTVEYNNLTMWNVNFNRGRSGLLDMWTTAGLLGLLSILLLISLLLREGMKEENHRRLLPLAIYITVAYVLLPLSLPILLLLFIVVSSVKSPHEDNLFKIPSSSENRELALIGVVIVLLVLVSGLGLFLGRTYVSELTFKTSLDAVSANKAQASYLNIGEAINRAPFVERYHVAFSQLNLLIATNILSRASQKTTGGKPTLEDRDRNTATQAIQQAIAQAKIAVNLNPAKASNWENLAIIYSNVVGIAQGADGWALSAYSQAISADPTNPSLALAAGSVYYRTSQYELARDMFTRAVRLKGDWANAYYNLAWALSKSGDNKSAIAAMEQVLTLVPPKSEDFKKATADLEVFKKTASEKVPTTGSDNLSLPNPTPSISPKLQLDEKTATPPAAVVTGVEEQGPFDLSGTPSPSESVSPTP